MEQVVIAGAGPTGLAAALGLAKAGIRSIVLEEKAAPSDHSKAIVILPRTLMVLESWGVLGLFLQNSAFVQDIAPEASLTSKPIFNLNMREISDFTPASGILAIPQERTERLLKQACEATGLVDLRYGRALTGFTQDENHVSITVSDGSSIQSQYLLGCDGAHSRVREVLDFHLEGKTYPLVAMLADVKIEDARDKYGWPRIGMKFDGLLAAFRFDDHHWRIIHVTEEKRSTITADSPPDDLDPLIEEDVETLLGKGDCEILWKSSFRMHERLSPSFRKDRVILVGDAAHLNSPAGGQGMNGGIQDAHNLTWKLAKALNGGNRKALLDSYEQERRHAIVHYQHPLTDNLTKFVILGGEDRRAWLFKLAGGLFNLPGLSRRLALQLGMLNVEYGNSALLKRDRGYVGEIMSDLALLDDKKLTFLYESLWPNGALLLFDDEEISPWTPEIYGNIDIKILRIVRPKTRTSGSFLRAATDEIWWQFGTRETRAVVVRPDGYIGWQSRSPDQTEIPWNVRRALGI